MADRGEIDNIISSLYRGACEEDPWRNGLEAILRLFGATAVALTTSARGMRWHEILLAVGPGAPRDYREWEANDLRSDLAIFVPEGEICIRDWANVLARHPLIEEMRSRGIERTLVFAFASSGGRSYNLCVSRGAEKLSFRKDEMDLVRLIGRHFAEAVKIRQSYLASQVKEKHQSQALDRLGIAGILVDPYHNVMPLNPAGEQLLEEGDCLKLRHNRLVAVNRSDDKAFQSVLNQILSGGGTTPCSYGLSLQRISGRRPLGVVVNGIEALCIASNRVEKCVLIFARDAESGFATKAPLLQSLFSFTPTEAKLAVGLAQGCRLEEIENDLHIRHNTARAHLRSIFSKTDVTRQAELVSLLANSVAPLGFDDNDQSEATVTPQASQTTAEGDRNVGPDLAFSSRIGRRAKLQLAG